MYPSIDPYETGYLDVGAGHSLYFELCGNPEGMPVVCLHGGPGGGSSPEIRRLFDPNKYKVIIFDQRGAGKSRFEDLLADNTAEALVEDIEKLRRHLGVAQWHVIGGSWGSTLGILYALAHPDSVQALILIGVFTATREEVDWQSEPEGAAALMMPEWYEPVAAFFAGRPKGQTVWDAMGAIFDSDDSSRSAKAATVYLRWNRAISRHNVPQEELALLEQKTEENENFMRIVIHYYRNFYNPACKASILSGTQKLAHIPCHIIHGRYDMICAMKTARDLHQAYAGSTLHIVQNGGHSALDEPIAAKIIEILDGL